MPTIITKEALEQGQVKMDGNTQASGSYKAKEMYLLSGLYAVGNTRKMSAFNTP
ncbi:hypothetical protein [Paenibacillus tyrfis]|uniref:hypothetical protein n=1 Tax=Paenibacillus tyrfis TaxID=1501230 RepID=UPI002491BF26|nr:hypothetical protein [Paenibacillus tyrfis]